jgi:hypothetical protein
MKGAGDATGAAGGVIGAAGSVLGGLAANEAGKYTRKVMRINGQNAQRDGVEQAARIREAARLAMGRQARRRRLERFPDGKRLGARCLRESAIEREIDLATVRKQATMKATAFGQQGDIARAQGRSAMIGGFISGAAGLMDAASQAFGGGA